MQVVISLDPLRDEWRPCQNEEVVNFKSSINGLTQRLSCNMMMVVGLASSACKTIGTILGR